jgi:riboflavin biosynthesis pyrimidine reductase
MNFEVLFDHGEESAVSDPAFERYGRLGFPAPPEDRPWIYSNFVQSLDGITSFKGLHASGSDISQSPDDRWLMDLLRAHADAVLLGVNTLVEEKELGVAGNRGPVYRVEDPGLRAVRRKLGRGREINIFVTAAARLDLDEFAVFDGEPVDAMIITTKLGAARLALKKPHPLVKIIVLGEQETVPLDEAMRVLRRDYGIRYLLCEGGPTLYGWLTRAGLVDEKFLTVSPVEVGQIIPREQQPSAAEAANPPKERPTGFRAPGFTKDQAPWWQWLSCRRIADHPFSRYRRKRPGKKSAQSGSHA